MSACVIQCRRCQSKTSNNMAAERPGLLLLQTFCPFTEPSGGTGEREKSRLSSSLMLAVGARNEWWTNPNFDLHLVLFLGGYAERNTNLSE
jgi:hypothetical protein